MHPGAKAALWAIGLGGGAYVLFKVSKGQPVFPSGKAGKAPPSKSGTTGASTSGIASAAISVLPGLITSVGGLFNGGGSSTTSQTPSFINQGGSEPASEFSASGGVAETPPDSFEVSTDAGSPENNDYDFSNLSGT